MNEYELGKTNYEVRQKVLKFTSTMNYSDRLEIILDPVFKSQSSIQELRIFMNEAKSEENSVNYQEYLELLIRYQEYGESALHNFFSQYEIKSCFSMFAFGLNSFDKRKDYLISKPFLMDTRSLNIITAHIDNYKSMPASAITTFRLYRNLLKASKLLGINIAFKEFEPTEQKYADVYNIISRSSNLYEIISISATYKEEMHSDNMRNVFHYLQAKYETNLDIRNDIIANWDCVLGFQSNKNEIWFWESNK